MIHQRPLTLSERTALPSGLVAAMPEDIVLVGAHHPLSQLSLYLRGYSVILVRGHRVFWPGLPADLSRDPRDLSVLAHELVHVWQYRTGMTLFRYIVRDVLLRLGQYAYRLKPGKAFTAYGYEQQAAMMEDWMRLRAGLPLRWGRGAVDMAALRAIVPFV
jgi:hypothetical protein